MNNLIVENMYSSRGNAVPNQFLIETKEGIYFQSYRSIVAFKPNGRNHPDCDICTKIQLGSDWNYSNTTMKYMYQFLGHGAKETRKRLKSGEYTLNESFKSVF